MVVELHQFVTFESPSRLTQVEKTWGSYWIGNLVGPLSSLDTLKNRQTQLPTNII